MLKRVNGVRIFVLITILNRLVQMVSQESDATKSKGVILIADNVFMFGNFQHNFLTKVS